jgi:hypothetical protein
MRDPQHPDGWFPHFAPDGRLVSGSEQLFADGQPIGRGRPIRWISPTSVIWNSGVDTRRTVLGGETTQLHPASFSMLAAGAGHWAGWNPTGVFHDGVCVSADGDQPWIGRDGAFVYKTLRASESHGIVFQGREIVAPRPHIVDPRTEGGVVVWSQFVTMHDRATFGWRGGGVEDLRVIDAEFDSVPIPTPDGVYVLTGAHWGFFIRKWGERQGWTFRGTFNTPDAICLGDVIYVAGAAAGGRLTVLQFPLHAPKVAIQTAPTPPAPTPPPPSPPQPPEEEPPVMEVPDRSAFAALFLGSQLLRYDGDEERTRAHSFEVLNALCHALRETDPCFGLLEKRGGARVRNRAADILAYDLGNGTCQLLDVIANAEGWKDPDNPNHDPMPKPAWRHVPDHEAGIRPIGEWTAPYPIGDVQPHPQPAPAPPAPEPAPGPAIGAELASASASLRAIAARLDALPLSSSRGFTPPPLPHYEPCTRAHADDGPGYEAMMAMVNEAEAQPRGPMSAAFTARLIWRFLREGVTHHQLVAEARAREEDR